MTVHLEAKSLYRVEARARVPADQGTQYPFSAELRAHGSEDLAWRGSKVFVGAGSEGEDSQVFAEFEVNQTGDFDLSWLFDSRLDVSTLSFALTEVAIPRFVAVVLLMALVPGMTLGLDLVAAHLNHRAALAQEAREDRSKVLK